MSGVDKMFFRFVAHDESFVSELYAKWEVCCQPIVERIVEEAVSSFDEKTVKKCVDRLELTIGNIPEDRFFDLFPVRLREELHNALSSHFNRGLAVGERAGRIQEENTADTGPWDPDVKRVAVLVHASFENPPAMQRMVLQQDNAAFCRMLACWLKCREIQPDEKQKAVSVFAKKYPYLFLQVLQKGDPGETVFVDFISLLDWSVLDYPFIVLSQRQATLLQRTVSLLPEAIRPGWSYEAFSVEDTEWPEKKNPPVTLLRQNEKQPDDKDLLLYDQSDHPIGERLRWWSDHCSIEEKRQSFISCLEQHLASEKLSGLIGNAQLSGDLAGIMDDTLIMQTAGMLCRYPNEADRAICWSFFTDWVLDYMDRQASSSLLSIPEASLLPQARNACLLKKEGRIRTKFSSGTVTVNNAGLVLLAPWFPKLFSMLGLLDDEKKNFVSSESRNRAIFIIQRMVTSEKRRFTEDDLIFNRVLVNAPFGESLPGELDLTPHETDTVEAMLKGVKANWPQMVNTSISGFQHSFIKRQGLLEFQEEKWLLTVAPCSYDILLDSLPWAYQLIRFPWLENRITVRWK